MTLRRLCLLALAVAVAGPVLVTVVVGAQQAHAAHTEAAPCPDPGDNGAPCDPGCPCTCCPGHAPSPAVSARPHSVAALASSRCEPPACCDLMSQDLHHRIFHPPRA